MTTMNDTIHAMINGGNSTDDIRNVLDNIDATQSRIIELTAQRDAITAELAGLTNTADVTTATESIATLTGAIDLERIELARLVAISSGRARGMTIGIEIEFKVLSDDYDIRAREMFRACLNTRFGSDIVGSDVRGYPFNHNKYATKWKLTGDGSLTRNGGLEPMELISPILKGERGLMQAVSVMDALRGCGAEVDRQCSIHVHFGVERMNTASIKRILTTYVNNQELIASALPASRRNSQWARYMPTDHTTRSRWSNGRINLSDVLSHPDSTPFNEICSSVGGSSAPYPHYRYFACNAVSAYEKHKTIEFRAHGGTVESEKLEMWVRFLHMIVKSAETNRPDTILPHTDFKSLCATLSDKTDLTLEHAYAGNGDWARMVNAIKTGTDTNRETSAYRSRAKAQLAGQAIADYMQERADTLELQGN